MARLFPIGCLLASLLACGGLEDRVQSPDPAAVRIGYINFQSNDLIDDMSSYGAALAVAEINQKGGVLGRRLQLITTSDRPGATPSVRGTRDLLQAGVVAIIGGPTSALHLEMIQASAPAGIPLVSPSATSPSLSHLVVPGVGMVSGTLSFRTAPSDALQGRFLAERIHRAGVLRLGALCRDDAYGRGLFAAFKTRFEELGGRLALAGFYDTASENDLGRQVEALVAAGPVEGVLLVSFVGDGTRLSQHLAARLPRPLPQFFGSDGINNLAFFQNAEPIIAEGLRGSAPAFPASPAIDAFDQAYRAELGVPSVPSAVYAYDAVYAITLAVAAGKEATPQAVQKQLRRVTGGLEPGGFPVTPALFEQALSLLASGRALDFQGLTGRLDLDAQGDPTQATYAWWRYRKGALETLEVSEVGAHP